MDSQIAGFQNKGRRRPVIPLTVQQILNCKQQNFKLFGIPIQVGCVVAVVKDVAFDNQQISCFLEDFTGTMKAVMCFETKNEMASKSRNFISNKYAQVFGTISGTQNVSFSIMKVIPVDDANVITCHLLQVIYTRLEAESELKKQIANANTAGTTLANALGSVDDASTSTAPPKLNSLESAVLSVIEKEISHNGITKQEIFQQFHPHQAYNVNQIIEFFINEGVIYPTIDQNHFKVVNNI